MLKWEYPTGASVWAVPAIGRNGTTFAGSSDSTLYAIVERHGSNGGYGERSLAHGAE